MTRAVDVVVIGSGMAALSTTLGLAATRDVLLLSAADGSTP
jgi:L-aspartate oxidase